MHDPIRMVVISIISSVVLGLGLLFYKYIYPKKNINLFVLLILIALLPLISMLRPGSYESGDLSEHVKISMMFFNELSQGSIVPSWTDLGCSGYGCPIFSFQYILPYYLVSFFHVVGFSFVDSVKLLLGTSFIASGLAMYFWVKDEFGDQTGFIAAIFYLFAPYHLVDLHFRNAIGEMLAFAVMPLCFLFTKRNITNFKPKWIVLNAFAISALILSHLVATLITLPFLVIYGLIVLTKVKQKKLFRLLHLSSSFVLALLLTAFYWLPIALEGKYIYWGLHSAVSWFPLYDLLFSPWKYGLLFQGPEGQISHLIGYSHLIIIILAIYIIHSNKIKTKKNKILLCFFLIVFLISTFMILPISKPLWEVTPLIKSFQFSYRLLIFNVLCSSIIAGILLKDVSNKRVLMLICSLTILITILNWGNRRAVADLNDNLLKNETLNIDTNASPLTGPIWMENNPIYGQKRILEENKMEIISGKASITKLMNISTQREYLIYSLTPLLLKENTFYYPGWKVYANNKEIPIIYTDKNNPGIIMFKLKPGFYKIDIKFTDTLIRTIGKYISIVTITFLLIIFFSSQLFIYRKLKN